MASYAPSACMRHMFPPGVRTMASLNGRISFRLLLFGVLAYQHARLLTSTDAAAAAATAAAAKHYRSCNLLHHTAGGS